MLTFLRVHTVIPLVHARIFFVSRALGAGMSIRLVVHFLFVLFLFFFIVFFNQFVVVAFFLLCCALCWSADFACLYTNFVCVAVVWG